MNQLNQTSIAGIAHGRQAVVLAMAVVGLTLGACNQQAPDAPAEAGKPAQAVAGKTQPQATPAAPAATPRKAAAPVCADCASVVSVTPVEREGTGSGAGAIVGGLVGAALGNQVGQGQGKDLATVAGAIGGGFAGNAIEKNMKKTTVFQIALRMDDGSQRSMELADAGALKAGARVRVDGANLVALPAGK